MTSSSVHADLFKLGSRLPHHLRGRRSIGRQGRLGYIARTCQASPLSALLWCATFDGRCNAPPRININHTGAQKWLHKLCEKGVFVCCPATFMHGHLFDRRLVSPALGLHVAEHGGTLCTAINDSNRGAEQLESEN